MRHVTPALPLVALLGVVALGCGGGSARAPGAPPPAAPAVASPAQPAAMSPQAYGAKLERAARNVDRILDAIRGTRTQEALSDELHEAAGQLQRAGARLRQAQPPRTAAEAHAAALAGLQRLSVAASALADEVDTGETCTSPHAVARLTRSAAAGRLRSAAARLRAQGFRARGLAPRRRRAPRQRLANGTVLRHSGSGTGLLTVRNGDDDDAVVVLADGPRRVSLFVRRHATAAVEGIPDGTFRVFVAGGRGWDPRRNTFGRSCSFKRFKRRMAFRSSATVRTTWKLTLAVAFGGNARATGIDPEELPR